MKLPFLFLVSVLAFGFSISANAGNVADNDPATVLIPTVGDLVPTAFDNCDLVHNGPNQMSNQVDTDADGYGNACDVDYDNDFSVTAGDFGVFLGSFGRSSGDGSGLYNPDTDHDGDDSTTAADFGLFLGQFGPGNYSASSGLICAGDPALEPCTP